MAGQTPFALVGLECTAFPLRPVTQHIRTPKEWTSVAARN